MTDKRRTQLRAADHKWYLANKDKAKARAFRWITINPERRRAISRKWYRRNREQAREIARKWRKANPEKFICLTIARRARQRGAIVPGFGPAINKIYSRARELRKWFDVAVDHIVPLSKGGLHAPSNLQIIYRTENLTKSARTDYGPQVIFI